MSSECALGSETIDLLSAQPTVIGISAFVLTNQKQMWCDWQPSDYKNRRQAISQ